MKRTILTAAVLLLVIGTYAAAFTTSVEDWRWNSIDLWRRDGVFNVWALEVEELVEGSSNLGTGNVYYVDPDVADEGDGTSWSNAKDTLEEAIQLCTANNGDRIYVAQGSTHTMGAAADEVDADIAGITIIGAGEIGNVDTMPLFDYTGDVTGAFAIGADGVTLVNLHFRAAAADVNEAIEIEAGSTDWAIIGCVFDASTEGTHEFHECITSHGAASDRGKLLGCRFAMGAGAARSGLSFKDVDYAEIAYNWFDGDYAVADINNATTASNHIYIHDNRIFNGTIGGNAGLNAQPCIELLATTTGTIEHNSLVCNVANGSAAYVGADMYLSPDNWYSESEATPGYPLWAEVMDFDHFMEIACADITDAVDMTAEVPDNTVLANILDDGGDTSAYDRRTHSLVAIGDDTDAILADTSSTTGIDYWREHVTAKTATADSDDLFDVAGGPIEITAFYGIVTTAIDSNAATIEITMDADSTYADYDFSTAVNWESDAKGTRYTFADDPNNPGEAVLTPLEGADAGAGVNAISWFCAEGMIEQACSAANLDGVVVWYMRWRPLATGVTVTAQ